MVFDLTHGRAERCRQFRRIRERIQVASGEPRAGGRIAARGVLSNFRTSSRRVVSGVRPGGVEAHESSSFRSKRSAREASAMETRPFEGN